MATWFYVCVVTSCGHIEMSVYAPTATKRCPKCGAMTRRDEH